ncbi:MAG: hypothetical protein QOF71_2039 [Candidatus Eremiobacteraeota bacterium]|nr:hypothetical protein [Candidatus Eremiobacteraeota bacterium]
MKQAGTPESVNVAVIIGGTTAGRGSSSGVRRPKFVSPSTNGIDFKVYAHGGNTIIGQSDTDISSGSAACNGQTGTPRTCFIAVPAPAGNDDFVATTYDGAPANGSFASSHALGKGQLTATIASGQANNLTLYISGIINTLGFLAPHASLPADGAAHTLGFVLNPSDFDNNPISAGANDPYANPISVQLSETAGSGHATIVKNGTDTGGTSTTLNYSTDTVAVRYDGGASPGYYISVSVSSTNVTPETLVISPLYVTSASPYRSGSTLTFTASGQTAQVNLSETNNASATYTATGTACSGIATASAPTGPANAASTTITATGAGSCTFAFSDGMSTITWTVTVSTTGASVTVPSNQTGPITFASYSNGPVRGQNGWLSNSCGNSDYNANVVNTTSYPSAQWPGTPPTKALQVDNSVTQGCFSGLGSPVTPTVAGYPNALADTSGATPTQCGPTCQPFFSVEFVVTSATGAWQPALGMSLSPVFNNQGARMQYIGLWHTTDSGSNQKLLVFTNDVEGLWPGNPPGTTAPCFQCTNFVPWEIKYVDPALPHKIGMTMQFVQPNADVVKFYVDGVLSGVSQTQFRSWEDYYIMDTESDPGATYPYSRAVNDILFHPGNLDSCLNFADYQGNCDQRTSGPSHTSTANNGFLFTNITTCAGTAAVCAGAIQTSGFARSVQSRSVSGARSSASAHHTRSQLR